MPWAVLACRPSQALRLVLSRGYAAAAPVDRLERVAQAVVARTDGHPRAWPAKTRSQLLDVLQRAQEARELLTSLETLSANDPDEDMRAMAAADIEQATTALDEIRAALRRQLLPSDTHDRLNALVEVSMGVGGSEGGIFAGDLLDMYTAFAKRRRWNVTVVDAQENSGLGGFKRASLQIDGDGAFGALRREAGVHRVQRVPATEAAGRVHTSTAAVIVMPSDPDPAPEAELFSQRDIREEVMRAQGAGGQHVNKTESAVRITHVPTGISVSMQDSRSQHENRRLAYTILRARLLDRRIQQQIAERKASRLAQVSGSDRSDKIRTYNYNQDRVTDHRVPVSVSNLEDVVAGGPALDDLMELIEEADEEDRLDALLAD